MPIDDSYAPPGAFPNMAVNNLTITGSTSNTSTGTNTVSGSNVRLGSETIEGSLSVGGVASIGSVASVVGAVFTGATITGGNTGTLTNSPHTGNPFTFLEINVNGTVGAVPVYALS
jgi:hypothetical protein